jgi:hypothetical protein
MSMFTYIMTNNKSTYSDFYILVKHVMLTEREID